jgi:hypothetical protein
MLRVFLERGPMVEPPNGITRDGTQFIGVVAAGQSVEDNPDDGGSVRVRAVRPREHRHGRPRGHRERVHYDRQLF